MIKIRNSVLSLVAFFSLLALLMQLREEPSTLRYEEHVVSSGETLWAIADQSDLQMDKREIISYMVNRSGIQASGEIKPGMVISVPMSEKR